MENSERKTLGKIFSEVSEISENSEFSTSPFIYFTYSQNIQVNLLLQSTAIVTKYNKELLITIIIQFDCERDKITID